MDQKAHSDKWILVRAEVLPEVYHKVLEVSQALHTGRFASVSEAVRAAGISRSAYYKYKDSVAPHLGGKTDAVLMTVDLVLQDSPGVLSGLLSAFARVGANIRRTAMAAPAAVTAAESAMPVAGDLSINTDSHQVFRGGKIVELTQREYELLTFLASHPNKVYSRVDLMEQVWNYGYVGDDVRTVDVTVRRLREKIENDPANPAYILTRRGVGYYFSV